MPQVRYSCFITDADECPCRQTRHPASTPREIAYLNYIAIDEADVGLDARHGRHMTPYTTTALSHDAVARYA